MNHYMDKEDNFKLNIKKIIQTIYRKLYSSNNVKFEIHEYLDREGRKVRYQIANSRS